MNRNDSTFSCVIFDMDGTLSKTNDLIFASFNHVAQKYLGKTMASNEIIALFGPPEEGALRTLLGEERATEAMEDLCAYYAEHHAEIASLHPGIVPTLQYLKDKGMKLAVFTGKGKRTATITLERLGIGQFFDLVVSGNDVVNHKPHPEGINRVLATFSIPASSALMVGDALSDVRASRAAGVPMAAALWDCHDAARLKEAGTEFQFSSVDEMFAWFRAKLN
jgi:pyrophosphatase PpaX